MTSQIWFHCTNCDGYSLEIAGFDETKHFGLCECGSTMYLNRTGSPEEIGLAPDKQVKATTTSQTTRGDRDD